MKASGNEGCRSLLTSLQGVHAREQVRARVCIEGHLPTLLCHEMHLQAPLDLGTHIPEAGPLCSAHPSRTQPARGDGSGVRAVRSPHRSKDLPWREAVTGPTLEFLELTADFFHNTVALQGSLGTSGHRSRVKPLPRDT